MSVNETSSSPSGSPQESPGDPQIVKNIISQFRNKIREIDSLRGEIESETRRIDRDRATLKSKLMEYSVSDSKELKALLDLYQSQISSDFYSLQSSTVTLESQILRMEGEKAIHENQITESSSNIERCQAEMVLFGDTLVFLREVSEKARGEIIVRIETFVTQALTKIFGDGVLKFKMDMRKKGDIPFVYFLLEDCLSGKTYDILDSFGGGVADVVSTVLRLAILELQDPVNTGPVVLDEVGKFLSDDRQDRFGEFLRGWSEEFNRQIILVTHKPKVLKSANRIFKVTKTDTCSVVELIDLAIANETT